MELVDVGSEVGGGGRGLDGGGRGERGRRLRALVLLVEERVGEGSERRGGGGGRGRRRARGVDERGAHGGVLVPDAAECGGEDARDERRHGVARVRGGEERQQPERVPPQRRPVGGARVGHRGEERRELVGLQPARDPVQLGGRHGLRVAVGQPEQAPVHPLLHGLRLRRGAHVSALRYPPQRRWSRERGGELVGGEGEETRGEEKRREKVAGEGGRSRSGLRIYLCLLLEGLFCSFFPLKNVLF